MWFLRAVWEFLLDALETIVISMAVFAVVYLFLFQPHQVEGRSMVPNFHNGEYILTDKLSYRFHEPRRGDVVVFHSPQNVKVDFIKRVIAVPGDTIEVRGGYTYLNGKKLEEGFINNPGQVAQGRFLKEGLPMKIPAGHVFVMGDNRLHSSDSREWGLVAKELIVGRAFFRYWPTSEFGLISTNEADLSMEAVLGAVNNTK